MNSRGASAKVQCEFKVRDFAQSFFQDDEVIWRYHLGVMKETLSEITALEPCWIFADVPRGSL